jgi:aspartate-semialdehyde dehydrogenase
VTEIADRLTFDGSAVDFPEPQVYERPIAYAVELAELVAQEPAVA